LIVIPFWLTALLVRLVSDTIMDSFGESNVIIIQRRLGTEFFSGSDDVIVWILDWRVGLGQFCWPKVQHAQHFSTPGFTRRRARKDSRRGNHERNFSLDSVRATPAP
jgi:hypothetical protein